MMFLKLIRYKAWPESRNLFYITTGISLAIIVYSCLAAAHPEWFFPPERILKRDWVTTNTRLQDLFKGPYATLFPLLVTLLGLGGLRSEGPSGSLLYSLSLPTSAFTLALARLTLALLQTLFIVLLPVALLPILSYLLTGLSYPTATALFFAMLQLPWYFTFVAFAFLVSGFTASTRISGVLVIFLIEAQKSYFNRAQPEFKHWQPTRFMLGEFKTGLLHNITREITGPFPYNEAFQIHAFGLAFIAIALYSQRRIRI
jgi:hypothetical protein